MRSHTFFNPLYIYVNFAFREEQSSRQIMYYTIGPTECDAVSCSMQITPHAWLWTICWALGGTCPLQTGGKNGFIKSTVRLVLYLATKLYCAVKRSGRQSSGGLGRARLFPTSWLVGSQLDWRTEQEKERTLCCQSSLVCARARSTIVALLCRG